MKIAFTHNLQLISNEEQAEYDTPETVDAITNTLRELGHEVIPIEVSGSILDLASTIEAISPDLIFNTAEGSKGCFREAIYPSLYEQLGFAFTGSDAAVCALTLNKHLTKSVVAAHGIPTPKWRFIKSTEEIDLKGMHFPMIIKPNFEGSSIGIDTTSVVDTVDALRERMFKLLSRFTDGVIIEEFIGGRDITVPYLEKVVAAKGGILEPASYEYGSGSSLNPTCQLYDIHLKTVNSAGVQVIVPAPITSSQRFRCIELSYSIVSLLNIRDLARMDFRLGEDGEFYFLEVNALPSLEPGSSIYCSSALAGLPNVQDVIGAIVQSASERYRLASGHRRQMGGDTLQDPPSKSRAGTSTDQDPKGTVGKPTVPLNSYPTPCFDSVDSTENAITAHSKKQKLRVGLTYNLRHSDQLSEQNDHDAEYDTPQTVHAIQKALESLGHSVVRLEATSEIAKQLPDACVDMVFNIAEGLNGRHREAQIPSLLELLDIPYTGSDPCALTLALDKALAKSVVSKNGCATPPYMVMHSGEEPLIAWIEFPVIVKPIAEGSSKGIGSSNVVESESALREIVKKILIKYQQPALVENYLIGREFTIALIGSGRPMMLPPMEVIFNNSNNKYPIYSFDSKFRGTDVRSEVPARLDPALKQEIERIAVNAFMALGCRDYARVDLRLDSSGKINFIECNPLPGLSPGFSDLCLIAESSGISYNELIHQLFHPCLERWHAKRLEKP